MGHEFSAVMLKDRKVNLKIPIQLFISNSIHTGLLSIRPWIINIEEEKMYNSKICYFGFIYGVEVDYLVERRFRSNIINVLLFSATLDNHKKILSGS